MAVPRGSIFGALLLISIGALFLWANLDPSVHPWYLIGRYWPVLIIFWGFSKLVDYLLLRGTPEAGRAVRLGAGDIIALIFILLVGTALTQATRRGFWNGIIGVGVEDEDWARWLGNRYQFTEKLEQEIKTPGVLNLSNLRGSVTVIAQEGDRIQASVLKTIFAPDEAQAARRAQELEVSLEPVAGGYELRWKTPRELRGLARADLELRVPKQLSAKVETRRGDVRVAGLTGDVSISLASGTTEVTGIKGSVQVQVRGGSARVGSVSGDVEVRGQGDELDVREVSGEAKIDGEFSGPIRASKIGRQTRFVSRRTNFTAERVAGQLELIRGELNLRGVAGNVTLLAQDKDIYMDDLQGQVRIENRHGRIQLRFAQPPRQPLEVSNYSGDIELILPADSGFAIEARAPVGQIETDFTGPTLRLRDENHTAALSGNYGTPRANIRLSTRYGSIRLLRATPTTTSF